jgi:proteic killer suppression protein
VIDSFSDLDLESFYYRGPGPSSRVIPPNLHRALRRKLDQLQHAMSLMDLRAPPANHLEALKGDRQGFYSIRVNNQWRIVFRWLNGEASDVALVDYH